MHYMPIFSKDKNSGFKLLVLFFNNECYRAVSYEEIDVKINKLILLIV